MPFACHLHVRTPHAFAFPPCRTGNMNVGAQGPESDAISLRCVRCKRCSDEIPLTSFNPTLVAEQDRSLLPQFHALDFQTTCDGLESATRPSRPPAPAPGTATRSAPCRRWHTLDTGTPPETSRLAGLTETRTTPSESGPRT